jgi:hypothetical protein
LAQRIVAEQKALIDRLKGARRDTAGAERSLPIQREGVRGNTYCGALMGGGSLPRKVVTAFRSAGATEEMIASARLIFGSLPREAPGRPRMYQNSKEADHAFYMRHRDRFRQKRVISPNNDHYPLPSEYVEAVGRTLIGTEMLPPARVLSLKELLIDAAGGNVDREADVLTIRALLDEGCDLEADILPTVARMMPELPRPLKNWGAQWLVREILEARDQREAAHEPPGNAQSAYNEIMSQTLAEEPERPEPPAYATPELLAAVTFKEVEAPPPARRLSDLDWDEFVAGHRAGLIEWNTARLSPGRGGQGSARRRRELDLPLSAS